MDDKVLSTGNFKKIYPVLMSKIKEEIPKFPTLEETLEILMETGIIDPVFNNAGALYTDNNGKVYTL